MRAQWCKEKQQQTANTVAPQSTNETVAVRVDSTPHERSSLSSPAQLILDSRCTQTPLVVGEDFADGNPTVTPILPACGTDSDDELNDSKELTEINDFLMAVELDAGWIDSP